MHWPGPNILPPEIFSDGELGGGVGGRLHLLKCKGCLAIKKKKKKKKPEHGECIV